MGKLLDAWVGSGTLKSINATKLLTILEQAKMTYHAQAIRTMINDPGN